MANDSQIAANRKNAQSSTGPRTDEGRAASSRNALTLGLYTRTDYVRPEERDLYEEFRETMYAELSPEGLLEESFAAEIIGATWRLRRCSAAEADLGEYDEATDSARRSIERARGHAHCILNRSVNQLRKLQTERTARLMLNATGGQEGLADYKQVVKATNDYERAKHLHAKSREIQGNAAINQALHQLTLPDEDLASICKTGHSETSELGSARNRSGLRFGSLIPTEPITKTPSGGQRNVSRAGDSGIGGGWCTAEAA